MANSLTVTGGGMQGAFVSTAFATPVTILVKDASNVPQVGVTVTSSVPGAGASCTTAASAMTNGSGIASFTMTANATAGQYIVSWTSSAANTASALFRNSTPVSSSQTKTPTLATQEVFSGQTIPWSNPGFITATGTTNYAQAVNTSSNGGQLLKGSVFGFTIPTGSFIAGYKFDLYLWKVGSDFVEGSAYLFDGAYSGALVQYFDSVPTSRTHYVLGGATDLWTEPPLSVAQVNGDAFTVGLSAGFGGTTTRRTNEWSLTVYYNTAPALPVADTAAALNFCAN